jgi:hypothetical protein
VVVYPKMNPKTPSMLEAVLDEPTKGTLIVVKLVIPAKAPDPILVTVFGIVIEVRPVMFSNALALTCVASVRVIVVKLVGI